MVPRRVICVPAGMHLMSLGYLCVMGCSLMIAGVVMLRRFCMMVSSHSMMMGCLAVFVRCLIGHDGSSRPAGLAARRTPGHHRTAVGDPGYGGFN